MDPETIISKPKSFVIKKPKRCLNPPSPAHWLISTWFCFPRLYPSSLRSPMADGIEEVAESVSGLSIGNPPAAEAPSKNALKKELKKKTKEEENRLGGREEEEGCCNATVAEAIGSC
uniref:Uncharacterized protein n=1 Tax=Musa acuminata subsp. malaccensis TaxID=214687 RepID=A0A804I499_MUSAM